VNFIQVTSCTSCHGKIDVTFASIGDRVDCPHCPATVTVPLFIQHVPVPQFQGHIVEPVVVTRTTVVTVQRVPRQLGILRQYADKQRQLLVSRIMAR
jgi:hypothetical protein